MENKFVSDLYEKILELDPDISDDEYQTIVGFVCCENQEEFNELNQINTYDEFVKKK